MGRVGRVREGVWCVWGTWIIVPVVRVCISCWAVRVLIPVPMGTTRAVLLASTASCANPVSAHASPALPPQQTAPPATPPPTTYTSTHASPPAPHQPTSNHLLTPANPANSPVSTAYQPQPPAPAAKPGTFTRHQPIPAAVNAPVARMFIRVGRRHRVSTVVWRVVRPVMRGNAINVRWATLVRCRRVPIPR